MLKPLTPSAHRAARAMALGPIAPARMGTSAPCAGAGPTGSARGDGGSPAHNRRKLGDLGVEGGVAPGRRALGGPEVVAPPAHPDADRQPPAGQLVERGQLLGYDRHRVGREHDQVGEEAHPLGDHGGG